MKLNLKACISGLVASSSLFLAIPSAHAVSLKITFTNNDLGNGNVFSPLSAIFHDGGFDNFDVGQPVIDNPNYIGIEEIAELGDPSVRNAQADLYSGFAVATTVAPGTGPGETVSTIIDIDPAGQALYFNYAAMFVSSNDAFIGNDDPLAFQVFDEFGNFNPQNIDVLANTVWDAGTELNNELIGDAAIVGVNVPPLGSPDDTISTNVREHPGYIPGGEFESRGFFFPSDPNAVVANITIEAVTTPEASPFLGLLAIGGIGLVSKLKKKI